MAPSEISFDDYATAARARGFDEITERRWEPGSVVAEHRHPFAVEALVVQGDMWLTSADGTQHLRAGDRFTLTREAPHSERYGDAGATYWAARRTAG